MAKRWIMAGALASALALAAPAREARADPGELPVAVLTIGTFDAFEQADALTSALKKAVEESEGWTYAQLPKDQALLFLTSSLGCNDPVDAACEQKIGDELKVDHFVWGTLKKEGSDVVGELHLWSRGQGSRVAKFRFPVNVIVAGDQDFVKLTLQKFEEIAGPPPGAKLRIKAGAVSGTVFVDGKEVGKIVGGTASIELPKGSHHILVKGSGYEDMETTVDMKSLEQRDITLLPVRKSGGPDIQKILGVTAIGVGVAAAGVATFAGVRVMQINGDLKEFKDGTATDYQFTPDNDGCDPGSGGEYPNLRHITPAEDTSGRGDFVKSSCSDGRTFQTLTLAFWPIAGAFVGTGIILLATANWSGKGKEKAELPFLVLPSFGPQGGDVTFATRF